MVLKKINMYGTLYTLYDKTHYLFRPPGTVYYYARLYTMVFPHSYHLSHFHILPLSSHRIPSSPPIVFHQTLGRNARARILSFHFQHTRTLTFSRFYPFKHSLTRSICALTHSFTALPPCIRSRTLVLSSKFHDSLFTLLRKPFVSHISQHQISHFQCVYVCLFVCVCVCVCVWSLSTFLERHDSNYCMFRLAVWYSS